MRIMILSGLADCFIVASLLANSARAFTPSNNNNGIRLKNNIGAGNYGSLSTRQQQNEQRQWTSGTMTSGTKLGMFDQLSSAITEAAQNSFGNSKKTTHDREFHPTGTEIGPTRTAGRRCEPGRGRRLNRRSETSLVGRRGNAGRHGRTAIRQGHVRRAAGCHGR
mmetsp:Transcript_35072/g.64976  ORF Transcript_35072/g.64976 Transcript_35072/m.64976 type:complete len:165 (-) Transcript_35072:385-879(-)